MNRMLKDPHARRSAHVRPPPAPRAPRPSHMCCASWPPHKRLVRGAAGCGGCGVGREEGVQARGPAARRPLEGTGTESSAALEGAAWVKFVVGGTAAMQAVRWMWRRRWAGACGGLVVGRSGAWVWLWREEHLKTNGAGRQARHGDGGTLRAVFFFLTWLVRGCATNVSSGGGVACGCAGVACARSWSATTRSRVESRSIT